MTTLSDVQCAKFRQYLHRDGLELMQAESPHLTKVQLKAGFQAIEDFWESNRATIKSDIDTAISQTISSALAKKMGKFWLRWKWEGE